MTEFSDEKHHAPVRFRPGPGQVGQNAALRGLKPAPAERKSGGVSRGTQGGGGQQRLGLPEEPTPPEPTPDIRHLVYGMLHENAKDWGRDIPLGVWMMRSGHAAAEGIPHHDYLYGDGSESSSPGH